MYSVHFHVIFYFRSKGKGGKIKQSQLIQTLKFLHLFPCEHQDDLFNISRDFKLWPL